MNKISFILAICVLPMLLFSTTWTVGEEDCDFEDIQSAIDSVAVVSGDSIEVEDGTYDAITIGNKGLTIQAADGDTLVYIDGTGEYHCIEFTSACSTATTLRGLIIQNGNANGSGDSADGGGIHNDDVRTIYIDNCTITDNDASEDGGGIYFENSENYISNCKITSNDASDDGGGIYLVNSENYISDCEITYNDALRMGGGICEKNANTTVNVENCLISYCTARQGGGIGLYLDASGYFTDCIISYNESSFGGGVDSHSYITSLTNCTISNNSSYYYGGGLSGFDGTINLTNCEINNNISIAGYGGGLRIMNLTIDLNNCEICNNTAQETGGGIDAVNDTIMIQQVVIDSNEVSTYGGSGMNLCGVNLSTYGTKGLLMIGNSAPFGGAIYLQGVSESFVVIDNSTIIDNHSTNDEEGGINVDYYGGDIVLNNCIVWGNDGSSQISAGQDVTYSCVEGSLYSGTGNINDDPQFVDADSCDYHLGWNSPCMDAGDPNDDNDDDGTVCDMGYYTADEHDNYTFNNSLWYCTGFPRLDVSDGTNNGEFVNAIEMFDKIEYPDNPDSIVIKWQPTTPSLEGVWNSTEYDWDPSTCDTLISSTRGYNIQVTGADSGSSLLRVFGDLVDPSTEIPVDVSEDWNYVGYFLEESQSFLDALDSETLDSLSFVKTKTWSQMNYDGTWYGSGGTINYRDLVKLQDNNVQSDFTFTWQAPTRGSVEPYIRPVAEHFVYTEDFDYYPIFQEFGEDIPDEVAVYVNDVCKGAEVVDDPERFMLRAYVFTEPAGCELKFRFYKDGVEYDAEYEIVNINHEYRPGKLTTGSLEDYAFISFGTPAEEVPPVDTELKTYPNPFNPSVTISCNIAEESDVSLTVYNIKGQKVKSLIENEHYESGMHLEQIWNGDNDKGRSVSGGVYMIRMKAGNDTQTKKVILLK